MEASCEMTDPDASLHPEPAPEPAEASARPQSGILPSQEIRALVAAGEIAAPEPIGEAQIQPASLDLRLGPVAYRVRASFLPGPTATVQQKIDQFGMHALDLTRGAVLEKGCVYLVPLLEHVRLGEGISGLANPKSSTGRLDIFTRLIADFSTEFERVKRGYAGPLYLEISPRTFSIILRQGSRLNQLRLRRGPSPAGDAAAGAALRLLHRQVRLVDRDPGEAVIDRGLALSVDLRGQGDGRPIGYIARKHAGLIDVDKVGHYDPADFWEPVFGRRGEGLILNPDDFYILASKEAVTVPPDHAAEMVAYDTLVGEFRVHYAGFFDPAFGYGPSAGGRTRAVLEVRSHEVPFMLEDGQIVGRLAYERLTAVPDKLYGTGIGSSYQRQGLTLGKQFRQPGPDAAPDAGPAMRPGG